MQHFNLRLIFLLYPAIQIYYGNRRAQLNKCHKLATKNATVQLKLNFHYLPTHTILLQE